MRKKRRLTKVAVVTGASGGIGKAIAIELSKRGYALGLIYRSNDTEARVLQKRINAIGGKALFGKLDVASFPSVASFVQKIVRQFGTIHVLVNNAGVIADAPLWLMEQAEWDSVIKTNLTGVFNVTRSCIQHMMRNRSGSVVNISSVSGLKGTPGQCNYSASKGGVIALTRSLAKEVARFNIRANVIAPGFIETDMLRSVDKERLDRYLRDIPLGRFGTPDEVAKTCAFVLTCKYMTGQVVVIDGGLSG